MKELLESSAVQQAQWLAEGELSAAELTEFYLRRIEEYNERIQAFCYVAPQRARRAAKQWDAARRRGRQPDSPLSGVPTGIKDLALVRGMLSRFGSRALPPIWSLKDGVVSKRVRDAGMIILGKLATSEFGAMPVTEPDTHLPTRNPHNLEHTAGGSSGGTGAAVAGGLIPIGQGSDGAGSIRIPSAVGHLVGLKTTRGLVSHITPPDRQLRLSIVGPLARTVEDLAAFLDCITDEPCDFLSSHREELPTDLRVGLSTESPLCDTEPEYQEAAEMVARQLEGVGAKVERRAWPEVDKEEFLTLWRKLMANAPWLMESRLQPVTAWLRQAGKAIPAEQALATRKRLESQILDWFGGVDLWISPTIAIKPPKIGAWHDPSPQAAFENILGMGVYTAAFNVSGQPAISIPTGFDKDGLPIGVQIAAGVGRDGLLLRVARHLEYALGGFRADVPLAPAS